ncbi:MAG: FAD-dependent oxidoreductase [Gracilibacteraceae bacterium]|jgi:2,4-dienoyl-CoA reductase (NADPH2)|nr:FAD-dependent oxidoreductase [Gracilibacteraceae bacterium]
MELKRIFEPITINGLTLKNRLVMPAIHHLYTPEGYATERFNEYYWERAEGGVGLLIVGAIQFHRLGGGRMMMRLDDDRFIPGYKEFTDGVHQRDCKVAAQLYHAGRYTRLEALPEGEKPRGPSAVYSNFSKAMPQEMTVAEIKDTVEAWAAGAVRAQKAGFDAVEIIACGGYLITQFLSPLTNLRTDEYGGSVENRRRFPLEVIQAVRQAVGPNFPVFVRVAGNDFVKGSNTNTEIVEFAPQIEKAGADLLNVTGGWHESNVPQITADLPRAGYTYLAAAIKKVVAIPVIASNRLNDPIKAEETLALGRSDLINLGRTLIADPEWCNKAKEGRSDEIRRCVGCNQRCLASTFFGSPVACLINGRAGREYLFKDKKGKAPVSKNILVVGGGPGGCEFAIRAAERGHTVTLWERSDKIGGQLQTVAAPPSKYEFAHLAEYYRRVLEVSGVNLVLGKTATADEVLKNKFDVVAVAAGSTERTLHLPGAKGQIPVYRASQVLLEEVMPGKNVVVIGGGSVGCEVAQFLARKGAASEELIYFLMQHRAETTEKIYSLMDTSDRNVSIVEILKKIGRGFEPGTDWPLKLDLKRLGVKQYASSEVISVNKDTVILRTKTDAGEETKEIPCDAIVVAVGYQSENTLFEELKDKHPAVYNIGDSSAVGKISDAVQAANDIVVTL